MKMKLLPLIAAAGAAMAVSACSTTPAPPPEQPLLLGRIEAKQPASSTAGTAQSKLAMSPLLSAAREPFHPDAHQVYTLKSAEGVQWSVASTADFAIGACAQAWGVARPLNAGYARMGELSLRPSTECR